MRAARTVECGHPERKHRARGMCASCYQVAWAKENPERQTGNTWLQAHPERQLYHSRKQRLKVHGLTPEDYDRMWREQEGKCANPRCGARFPLEARDYRSNALQVDHCHASTAVRGLLCPGCNKALGDIHDDVERLLGLVEYLRG